jgi:pimeloyl-ACP methyl ester carboxylesterase
MANGQGRALTRCATLAAVAVGVGAAAFGGSAKAQAAPRTFVLVHGSWHGGWCWRRVSDRLEKLGHKVFAPTLTGLGERSHLLDEKVNLMTHITDIVNVIKWERLTNVILCGHSYAGYPVSGALEQISSAVSSIVYLDLSLLKNELRAIGWGQAERAASPISRGSTLIAMMQAADLGEGNNVACGGKLHATRPWAVLVEREMRSGVMMILKIARQYAAQVTLVEDDNVI